MKTSVITIKVDPKTKNAIQKVAEDLGFSLSALTTALYKQVARERRVEFSAGLLPTPYLEKILEEAEKDMRDGEKLSPVFDNAKDAIAYLRKQMTE
ncbi:MAG: type II toxin-antitoxin system RelB/DinJ family antitoxin [bacterium]|nr:type II toxin-antitoxin system RelB/DinJ family antitoxin [bacterium]